MAHTDYEPPAYVTEGMTVWVPTVVALPTHPDRTAAMRCVVVVAAGHHARVANTRYGFDRWLRIDALLVRRKDT